MECFGGVLVVVLVRDESPKLRVTHAKWQSHNDIYSPLPNSSSLATAAVAPRRDFHATLGCSHRDMTGLRYI